VVFYYSRTKWMKTSSADDVELKSREDLNRQKCERKKT
jgi:hypothetical protein